MLREHPDFESTGYDASSSTKLRHFGVIDGEFTNNVALQLNDGSE